MAYFISTRNSLQCRSHHQKLEEKYTHVNKIIALYKPHFNKSLYKKSMEHLDAITHEKHLESITRYSAQEKIMVNQEVQTDIQDIRCDLMVVNPNLVVVQNRKELPVNSAPNFQSHPSFYPPPIYSPMEVPHHPAPSPFPMNHMGWWGGYPSSQFWERLIL